MWRPGIVAGMLFDKFALTVAIIAPIGQTLLTKSKIGVLLAVI